MKTVFEQFQAFRKQLASLPSVIANPNRSGQVISTIEMHTGGEPLRVIMDGYPQLEGESVLERRAFLRNHHDALRRLLMFEPRGHADMYGCVLVPPNDPTADVGVIFLHNEGYSTMCGHAIIAISTLIWSMGWKTPNRDAENKLEIDAPCGRITSYTEINEGIIQSVRFHCVPSFVIDLDQTVVVPEIGPVQYDLAYGGAFYAYVDLRKQGLGFSITPNHYQEIISKGKAIKQAVISQHSGIIHPYEPELSFLYGTIFIDDPHTRRHHSRNVCVFADGEVDRCPTGSGVSGRMAIHHARGEIQIGESIQIESIIDTCFLGRVIKPINYAGHPAVVPEVTGNAYIIGQNRFVIDPNDPLKSGFLLR